MGRLGEGGETAGAAAAAALSAAAVDMTAARQAPLDRLGDREVGTRVLERDGPSHDEGSHRDMVV